MKSEVKRAGYPHPSLNSAVGNVRWKIILWLLIGGIINYLDRANLSIAAPEMIRELHLSQTDIGLLGTVFSWTYAIMQLPSGWLIDKFGAKRIYSIAVLWWSVATFLTGVCNKMGSLIGIRLLLGIGEAPCFPTSAKVTSQWFPKKERGLATGVWDSSSKWGPFIAPLLLAPIMAVYGWRSLFYITGLLGIVFIVFFKLFYKRPEESSSVSQEEMAYIHSDSTDSNLQRTVKWGELFKSRTVWGMILGFFCTIWIWNIFIVFLPTYLKNVFHVDLKTLGIVASIPWFGGIVGNLVGGYITKKIADRGKHPMTAKRAMVSVCALLAAVCVILVPFASGLTMSIILMTLALGFISAMTGSAWALTSDVAPSYLVASVGAIQNFGGYFGGSFSTTVAGYIADTTGSFAMAFVSGGIIAGCAAICYWFIVKKPIAE
ncbi:MFS transporter [Paenibacillus filicis]|uniref:MFS transporter n=1 Tax=Paenibacillus gyeongsangnamensis TaxID=3388067 RepID=A0ABT4QE00_9BACL|nr:MFS transporter [Paenibacillus filicis]MCZ8515097.1 MFS transporter [Paenibacillus filicis]